MAKVGAVIENPATGERIRFVETSETTGGRVLRFELCVAPYGVVGGVPHRHPVREEVAVRSGVLSARIRGRRHEAGPGETLTIPPNAGHYLWNDCPDRVEATVTATPARDLETFFERVFAIAAARRYRSFRGLPPPLEGALLAATYRVYAPAIPLALQRPLVGGLAALARRRGYRLES